jgi:hypothetical protein
MLILAVLFHLLDQLCAVVKMFVVIVLIAMVLHQNVQYHPLSLIKHVVMKGHRLVNKVNYKLELIFFFMFSFASMAIALDLFVWSGV